MKIALVGYGKMGKTIEQIAIDKGHSVGPILDRNSSDSAWTTIQSADVVIEFTAPASALENYERLLKLGVPIVTGTTGWYDQIDLVKEMVAKHNGSFFWASNFSIGVNLFWEINQRLAALMSKHPSYAASMTEIHHTQKLDEPSGTAITTAEQITNVHPNYRSWKLTSEGVDQGDLPIDAQREGDVKGTHIVRFDSNVDQIELSHKAKSRDGFALGAILAAEFLSSKKGFYTMSDMLRL
ncbi:MAG TPA: 4-hydroxy-tetrahydrodipicolinate reductase [Flavobacteriales bacterium]|jgi:4-hydroxy-tetrahydrodipicolinate reductase|nr:4-hydroxy-tetrahydrodipicolinate reductase [Flavobacteriales bacterium]MDB9701304.1 4-hydroxy-tetrahydrodipicolinate reductase [Salibacteraceae bacterium]HAW19053.1 4-hydroxy-tetrahydrodipicolinate reductase [Flavobacteriales bacterium]